MHQKSLISSSAQPKPSNTHDDAGNKKAKAGKATPVDIDECDKRSWIQSRSVALVLEAHPDGNSFTSEFWSECYARAKGEWDER